MGKYVTLVKTRYAKRNVVPIKNIVYFIKVKDKDIFKIGHSFDIKSMKKRFMLINAYNFEILHMYLYLKCKSAIELEKKIHKELGNYRIKGEWFSVNMEKIEGCIKLLSNDYYEAIYTTYDSLKKW